ncbi:pyridoxamine 5'-phosphate oxidase family protein [Streptomyces sp. YIM 98790]|uniref:pyridoxamine 5'-phosphate oxidase family protein n=1 Tax=Streptomyces sp. YIM 98790 TaxID=2689077 RepID=UPI001408738C|nr:pyridoxamine 5'-phosphate oxidase family protein [Streptomyces sp. YIM 98790]
MLAAPRPDTPDLLLAEALRLLPGMPPGRAAVTRRALPYIVPARHLVGKGGQVLLRIPTSRPEARQLDGTVLAYAADRVADGEPPQGRGTAGPAAGAAAGVMVQLIGTAKVAEPSDAERTAFGLPGGGRLPEQALYLRLTPRFAAVCHGYAGA